MKKKSPSPKKGRKYPWGPAPWQFQKPGMKKGTQLIWTPEEGSPIGRPIGADRARELSALRKIRGGGRPRSDRLRCFCGEMTLARAIQRNHNCEEPSLSEDI